MCSSRYFYIFVLISSALLAAVYINVGSVGFYLDDYSSIVYNSVLQSPVDYGAVVEKHKARLVSYIILALQNEAFGGNVAKFHYIGVFIHALMVFMVYLFSVQVFRLSECNRPEILAFIAGILYAIHPQNSQAVVYVVQQSAMYIALFYTIALFSYVKLRQASTRADQLVFTFLFVLSTLLAVFSKQNAVTLPIAILLIEWLYFQKYTKHITISLCTTFLVGIFILLFFHDFDVQQLVEFINRATIENNLIGRDDYFYTQLNVIADYIKQFFYPIGFRLEFDYELVTSIKGVSLFALVIHFLMITIAICAKRAYPAVFFGIAFYYLAHTVESSVIPITDLAFEHRTYLPNVGLLIAILGLMSPVLDRLKSLKKLQLLILMLLIAYATLLSILTFKRVEQWADPKAFYNNEVKLSPKSARAYTELAKIYIEENNCPLAIGVSEHALNLYESQRVSGLAVQPEFYQNYILCLRELGIYDKADYFEQHLLKFVKEPTRRSFILFQRGTFLLSQHDFKGAEKYLTESIKLNGKNHNTAINLAITKVQLGKNGHAIKLLEHAIALKPNDQSIREIHSKLLTSMQNQENK